MQSIINVSQPQMGKTTHTLEETETCIEFLNLNMVFEYNITVEDVLQKAEAYSFTCERVDKRLAQSIRKSLISTKILSCQRCYVELWMCIVAIG